MSDEFCTDKQAEAMLAPALKTMTDYYEARGVFQGKFGFGKRPAIIVVDFAYGWTDEAYSGGTSRMDAPVEATRVLLDAAREKHVPIYFTTLNYRPEFNQGEQQGALDDDSSSSRGTGNKGTMVEFKPFEGKLEDNAAPAIHTYRKFDERACEIDSRLARRPAELIIPKESASAFHGTPLLQYLIGLNVDTVLVTGCQTSACSRATAMDARSYNFRTHLVKECNGDRSAVAHVFSLGDIASRFADITLLDEAVEYLEALPVTPASRL